MENKFERRKVLLAIAAGCLGGIGIPVLYQFSKPWLRILKGRQLKAETFIAAASSYQSDLSKILKNALQELGVTRQEITGKRILLKPNLVETRPGAPHVNTNPMVVYAAIDAFMSLGAAKVVVAEGPGHCHDSLRLLDQSGMIDVLHENRTPFVDINYDNVFEVANRFRISPLSSLILPEILKNVDLVVSMAKMKTHHWAGVTLSMKNLFGIMPGSYYGWPKNILHMAGINEAIMDIYASTKPYLAIVDGIVGMEGDGPIMGDSKQANVLVVGKNFPAVDATCARIMGINPGRVKHLSRSNRWLGPISEKDIEQRGEEISRVQSKFALLDKIPAHSDLMR